jgi:hypothetical protein
MKSMQKLKFKTFVVCLSILFSIFYFLFSGHTSADEQKGNDFIYLFHLYYDNDQLFADRDFEFNYDVIPEEFVPEAYNTGFPFKGEIVNFKNEVSAEFLFDPRRGNPNFLKGKISVKAPYVADGQKTVFYDSQGRTLLTVFVSESSFCNDDGVCNFDRGEYEDTCPNDCTGVTPPPPLDGEDGGGQGSMLMTVIYVLIIVGGAFGGWYGWKLYRTKKETPQDQLPNNIPPQQLP